jgi:hypothetical protein
MSLQWPEDVLVLDPECGHKLTDQPGADLKNTPHNAWGWAQLEIRKTKAPQSQQDLMLRIWFYRYDCLRNYLARYKNTYTIYDVYNAAWVSCGYVDYQDESAIELCSKRFTVPDGTVLDDPMIKSKKRALVNA